MTTQNRIPPPPNNSGISTDTSTIPPPPDGSGFSGNQNKQGFDPYEGVAITEPPPKPTTFWQELGHQLYSEPDDKNPTIAYQLVHPLVEGVKQGFKDIGEAVPEFMDSPLHSTLKTVKGAGEIAFNLIPSAVGFSVATHAIKMAADQTPYGKEISNVLDVPFQLAHKTLDVLGWTPEKDSNGDMAADVLDIVIGGLIAHETLGAKKVGELKDLKGEVVKDKAGNSIPVEVPTIAGKLINSFKDLTGITEKAAKGELKPEQMKELADYLESLKKVTPNDIINSAEGKLPTIENADEANAKINPDEQTDRQKSDMLHDLVKSGNAETFKAKLQEAKDNGSLTKEQADEGFIRLNSYEKNIGKINKYNLPEDKSKDATHLAWNVENTASHIKSIENIPEHKQDPIDEANLINLRDQYKGQTKELADILANKPKEVAKEDIKQAENDILLDSEVAWIKKKENWEEVRDNLSKQLQRDPTYKETFAAARKKYREEHPIKTPKENIASQKSFEKYVDNMSDEDKLEFEKEENPEAKTETVKEDVKAEPKLPDGYRFVEPNEILPMGSTVRMDTATERSITDAPVKIKSKPKVEETKPLTEEAKAKQKEEIKPTKLTPIEFQVLDAEDKFKAKKAEIESHPEKQHPATYIKLGEKKAGVKFDDGTTMEFASFRHSKKTLAEGEPIVIKSHVNANGYDVLEAFNDGGESLGNLQATNKKNTILKSGERIQKAPIEKQIPKPVIEESQKPVIDLDKKSEAKPKEKNPYTQTSSDPNFKPLEKRSEKGKELIEKTINHLEKSPATFRGLGLGISEGEVKGVIKDIREGKNTYRANALMDTLEKYADNGFVTITEGSGFEMHGIDIPIDDYIKIVDEALDENVANVKDINKLVNDDGSFNIDSVKELNLTLEEENELIQLIHEDEINQGTENSEAKLHGETGEVQGEGKPQEQKRSSEPSKDSIKEVISRLQKALPKLEVVYDDTIEGAGQLDANGKTVRINPFKSGTDTPIHEYAHALIDVYGGLVNKLVKGAVERLKTTPLWSEVADRYPELSDDMLAKEVLAEAIGREGKKIFEKERDQTYFKNFVDNFFFKIKKLLGLEKDNVKVLAKQLLSGKELSRETVAGHEAQLQKLSNDEALKQFAEIYHKKSVFEKFRDNITEAANIPRALMTSFDMSAPFRQAVVLTLRHPILATRAAREMFKQSFSQEAFDNWLIDMRNNEHYEMMKDAGLYISDPHTSKLSAKEEHFMTNMAQKIPVIGSLIKGSERAYVAYLNKIRTDVFINAIEEFKEQGLTYEKDPKVYKAMAEFINNATGRGNLGKLETSAQTLNTLFFSPRLIASRLRLLTNMVNPEWYKNTPKIVRVKEMQAMGAFIALGSSILLLSHIAGAKVSYDPRSSDFGKIQIGKTRLDIWGGFQQWVRATAQILSGTKIAASGKKIDLDKGRTSRFDVAENFALGKLAPIPALAIELLKGHDMQGNKLKLSNLAAKNLVPLYLQDMADAAKQGGGIGMLSVGIPAFFGVGTQTYDTSKK